MVWEALKCFFATVKVKVVKLKLLKVEENIAKGKMDPDIECFRFIESFVSINIHQLQVYHSTISALFAKRRVKNPM